MKPRITYPRTVVLPKDCEQLWLAMKENNPTQSFNGWITRAVRDYYGSMDMTATHLVDKFPDEA